MSRTTKKWCVIALGTVILILTYLGVFKNAASLYYGIMCCLFLYAYILIQTPASWDHEKGLKSCIMMILQEGLRLISILLFISIFIGGDNFKQGTLYSILIGLGFGLVIGFIRYKTHIAKDTDQ